jgi:hypothetical protein
VVIQKGNLRGDAPLMRQVIGIEPRDVLSLRQGGAVIERRDESAMLLPHEPDAGITETGHQIRRAITRTIVNNHNLEVFIHLREQTADRRFDRAGRIVDRHYNRDERSVGHFSTRPKVEWTAATFITVLSGTWDNPGSGIRLTSSASTGPVYSPRTSIQAAIEASCLPYRP